MEAFKSFLKDTWKVLEVMMSWIAQWWNWVIADPVNAAWWMGGVTMALAGILVMTIGVRRSHQRQNARLEERKSDGASAEAQEVQADQSAEGSGPEDH